MEYKHIATTLDKVTDVLNNMAQEGWSLTSIDYCSGVNIILERPKESDSRAFLTELSDLRKRNYY